MKLLSPNSLETLAKDLEPPIWLRFPYAYGSFPYTYELTKAYQRAFIFA
jgi:hypothetical protein